MYCSKCGDQQVEGSRFCKNCGAPLDASPAPPPTGGPGRGAAILTLGILSLVTLGFLAGIPAWIMGRRDLRRIQAGEIAASEENFTKAGMIMGIVGTCLSIVMILIFLIFMFTILNHARWGRSYRIHSVHEQMLLELRAIADDAVAYRARQGAVDGGATFVGYAIPDGLRSTATAEYSEGTATTVVISFLGEANDGTATVTVSVDADGKIIGVHFGEGSDDDHAFGPDARDTRSRGAPIPLPL